MSELRKISREELAEILEAHKKWLIGEEGGKRADLSRAKLSRAKLRRAALSDADLSSAKLSRADLSDADLSRAKLSRADLSRADLRWANLISADLRWADLRWADLDYSCWPLWCGGLHVKTDRRIMAQLAYHFCNQECDDPDYINARNAILDFANTFHRVDECGKLERIEPNSI